MKLFSDLKTITSKIETEIEKLWQKAPSFDTVALTTLTFAGPVLETVVSIEAGAAAGAAVTAVINKVESDLIAAKHLITVIGPTPSLKGILAGVQADLASLLTASQITDAKSVSNVTLVVSEIAALVNAFPATTPAPAPAAA